MSTHGENPRIDVVIVPGFWEGPTVFTQVVDVLSKDYGLQAKVASLSSTGQTSPGNPSLEDDIAGVHKFLEDIVTGSRTVLLVAHSAGGFIGGAAMKHLSVKERTAAGNTGGVARIAYICAGVVPPGSSTSPQPFMEIQGSELHCRSPRDLLFGDLSDQDADFWLKRIRPQPAIGWDGTVSHAGFVDAPSDYLVCENDGLLPVDLQKQLAAFAGADVSYLSSGHMPMLSQPGAVASFIAQAVQKI